MPMPNGLCVKLLRTKPEEEVESHRRIQKLGVLKLALVQNQLNHIPNFQVILAMNNGPRTINGVLVNLIQKHGLQGRKWGPAVKF